ncbi:hypothetical protein NX786_01100 [Telluria mixta]|uniref:Uncharacterized protein n=1 Tax=Telluria mixta TaxID=34071 RepID=A0ABT2BS50_9BURK|nr:hypothetical protein [Telluria mixta]MCS0627940.1 hypothetical protein [Telluria mixta]WEM93941.1 hypothetical protein P0M04_20890 [Telluria mixta]
MPKLRSTPPITGVEKELMDAFKRLEEGVPNHPDLLKKARLKKLRINATTVALEAGRARTLIAHDKCAYPRVRAKIKSLEEPKGPSTSYEDVNRTLREQNIELRKMVIVAASRVAAMIRRMDAVDKKAAEAIKKVVRKTSKKEDVSKANNVAGARRLNETLAVVIPLQKDSDSAAD